MSNLNLKKPKNPYSDELYESQKIALDKLEKWYKSDKLETTLEGCAGTGKTFILRYFINHIVDKSYTITAPTHKALRVLEDTIGVKGKTLQSLHGLKLNTDLNNFDIERPQFDPLGNVYMNNYNLIIIDECSMINSGLYKLNTQRAKEFNVKILYVGDSLQLPPVGEIISPTFEIQNKIILTEIVRQEEGNPLLECFKYLRQDILNNTNTFINHIFNNKSNIINGNGYELLEHEMFKEKLLTYYDKSYKDNPNKIRTTCFTNQSINEWNGFIRNSLIESKDIITYEDVFTSYSTMVDQYNSATIVNSEDYNVFDLREFITEEEIFTFAVNFESISDKRVTTPFLIVNHNDISHKKYIDILDLLHLKGVRGGKGAWIPYYNFKNRILAMNTVYLPKSKKYVKKDVDYAYALTTHKLQGSTFENIAIDLRDIVYVKTKNGKQIANDINLRNKLLYVAMSRAKHTALLRF